VIQTGKKIPPRRREESEENPEKSREYLIFKFPGAIQIMPLITCFGRPSRLRGEILVF
jgi:hypothetical protein